MQIATDNLLVFYIKGEDGISKSQVIQVLEMRFIFLDK